jgi:hypothetical protein
VRDPVWESFGTVAVFLEPLRNKIDLIGRRPQTC